MTMPVSSNGHKHAQADGGGGVIDVCRDLLRAAYPHDDSALAGPVVGHLADVAKHPEKVNSRKGAQYELEQLQWLMALDRGQARTHRR
jgi:hypothetical protein